MGADDEMGRLKSKSFGIHNFWGFYLIILPGLVHLVQGCNFDERKFGGKCRKCPKLCKPGTSMHHGCKCLPCKEGVNYSSHYDRNPCLECPICPVGREVLSPCNTTHPTICKPCPKGTFQRTDGSCGECTFCCYGQEHLMMKDCYMGGMSGDCSCREHTSCTPAAQNKSFCTAELGSLQPTPTPAPPPTPPPTLTPSTSPQNSSVINVTNDTGSGDVRFANEDHGNKRAIWSQRSFIWTIAVILLTALAVTMVIVAYHYVDNCGLSSFIKRHSSSKDIINPPGDSLDQSSPEESSVTIPEGPDKPPALNPDYQDSDVGDTKEHADGDEERHPFIDQPHPPIPCTVVNIPVDENDPEIEPPLGAPYDPGQHAPDPEGALQGENTSRPPSGISLKKHNDQKPSSSSAKEPVPESETSPDGGKTPYDPLLDSRCPKTAKQVSDPSFSGDSKPEEFPEEDKCYPSHRHFKTSKVSPTGTTDEKEHICVGRPCNPGITDEKEHICVGRPCNPVDMNDTISSDGDVNNDVDHHKGAWGQENKLAEPIHYPVEETARDSPSTKGVRDVPFVKGESSRTDPFVEMELKVKVTVPVEGHFKCQESPKDV